MLSEAHIRLLRLVRNNGMITAETGRRIYYDHASFYRAVNMLIFGGYVFREKRNRRPARYRYGLTPKGLRLLDVLS